MWRACVRLGPPLRRVPAKPEADQRRFAYPHRMMMVLADGKHFRASPDRRAFLPPASTASRPRTRLHSQAADPEISAGAPGAVDVVISSLSMPS